MQDIRNIIPARFPSTAKITETIFLTVNFLNRREIPHRLESHNVLASVPMRTLHETKNPTYGQTSLRRTDRSRTTNETMHMARHPYDVLTAVAQRMHCQTSLHDVLTAVALRKLTYDVAMPR